MGDVVQIRCKNIKKTLNIPMGSTLSQIFNATGMKMRNGPINAKVNNKVEGMHYRVYNCKTIEFLDLHSSSAMRAYTRTLFMVLCKSIHDLYAKSKVIIASSVSNGYYIQINIGRPVEEADVIAIRKQIDKLIALKIPIKRHQVTTEEAVELFETKGDKAKVKLLRSQGSLYTTYYSVDDYVDYYYGSLLTCTSELYLYGLELYDDGLLLRIPSKENPDVLAPMTTQQKMYGIFREHHKWQNIIGVTNVGELNAAISNGQSNELIHVSEALQEKKIARIAEDIAARPDLRMVLIAGPSSSGKTTFCKRLSIQLQVNGLKPIQVSLDDYFVDRELTPRDTDGAYDYESLYAINIPLINCQFKDLFEGKKVVLPKYDFITGRSRPSDITLSPTPENIFIVEGIHALNPELTGQIPDKLKYKIYASALTTLLLDDHNYIPTTDNRLLRRIVRDYKYRGCSAVDTIRRWPSVRRGEDIWIFPHQENADVMFNTAMLFELAVLRTQADPLLEMVPESCDEYAEAYRLRKFLSYIRPLSHDQIPFTSLLREFLGGSSFEY